MKANPSCCATPELATDHDLPELHGVLDEVLTVDDEAHWTDRSTAPGDEEILRATVRYEDGRLHVDANSVRRRDRIVDIITRALPGAQVVVDERTDPRDALRKHRSDPTMKADEEMCRVPDIGGPEISTWADLIRRYLGLLGRRRPVIEIPHLRMGAIREGALLVRNDAADTSDAYGHITWEEFLAEKVTTA